MNKQQLKRSTNRAVRKYRKMLLTDPYFEKSFDIQEVQMAFSIDYDVVYKRYAFIFKAPNGKVWKTETAWYNTYEIIGQKLFDDFNDFIMREVKWKVDDISNTLIDEYQEAYRELSK